MYLQVHGQLLATLALGVVGSLLQRALLVVVEWAEDCRLRAATSRAAAQTPVVPSQRCVVQQ